jgi:hypothetical protein
MLDEPHEMLMRERGSGLILEHCAALDRLELARASARARLEAALGDDLTRLLVGALTATERQPAYDDELDDDTAA